MRKNRSAPECIQFLNNPTNPWVLLCHGYGADAADLAPLAQTLDPQEKLNWLFPHAPIHLQWGGRAWWDLQLSQTTDDFSQLRPIGMNEAVEMIFQLVTNLKVPWNEVFVGGFSQGAMLATEVFLKAPNSPRGLLSLSGSLLSEPQWKLLAPQRKNETVFISHGEQDQVLPYRNSAQLQSFLNKNGVKTDFTTFRGGHEITPLVVKNATRYIYERLAKSQTPEENP